MADFHDTIDQILRQEREKAVFEAWARQLPYAAGPFWMDCDGEGGWVWERLAQVAKAAGLPVGRRA